MSSAEREPDPSAPLVDGRRSRMVRRVAAGLLVLALVGAPVAFAHRDEVRAASREVPRLLGARTAEGGGLQPDLARAVAAAQARAQGEGVALVITSGRRSRAHQQRLLDEAVARDGSLEEALRWVARPSDSRHVTGEAVDVGPPSGARWLERHGATFGLCRVFDNEPWHFELATEPGGSCPARWADNAARPPRHR